MSPRAAWMSMGAPAAAAAPRRAISAALASFISAAYARRLPRPRNPAQACQPYQLGRMRCPQGAEQPARKCRCLGRRPQPHVRAAGSRSISQAVHMHPACSGHPSGARSPFTGCRHARALPRDRLTHTPTVMTAASEPPTATRAARHCGGTATANHRGVRPIRARLAKEVRAARGEEPCSRLP